MCNPPEENHQSSASTMSVVAVPVCILTFSTGRTNETQSNTNLNLPITWLADGAIHSQRTLALQKGTWKKEHFSFRRQPCRDLKLYLVALQLNLPSSLPAHSRLIRSASMSSYPQIYICMLINSLKPRLNINVKS